MRTSFCGVRSLAVSNILCKRVLGLSRIHRSNRFPPEPPVATSDQQAGAERARARSGEADPCLVSTGMLHAHIDGRLWPGSDGFPLVGSELDLFTRVPMPASCPAKGFESDSALRASPAQTSISSNDCAVPDTADAMLRPHSETSRAF